MRILYTRPDGGLSVVHAAAKSDIEKVVKGYDESVNEKGETVRTERPLTQKEYEDHVWERSVPADAINPVVVADDYVLPQREFRDAWIQDGTKITHDLEKARNIQLERIRLARAQRFTDLDTQFIMALESGGDTKAIVDEKQRLRDITESLKKKTLTSIEDVKAEFPAEFLPN